jgi:hypothetical protein
MSRTSILMQIAGTLAIGLFMATRLGPAILAPEFLIPMSCLSMLFVGPLVVRTGKLIPSILTAEAIMAVSIGLSILLTAAGMPDLTTVAKAAAASLALTSAIGALALWLVGKLNSAVRVTWIVRGIMLALYLVYRNFPEYF